MIRVILDTSALDDLRRLPEAARQEAKRAAEALAAMAHAHAVEEASKRLRTRRKMFVEGLSWFPVSDDTWVVSLDAKVRWVDDGTPQRNMLDDLLKSPKAKRAKDGSMYIVIPFEHGPKGPTEMTQSQATLLEAIKTELKLRKIPYAKLETGQGGQPLTGRLHSFNIMDRPLRYSSGPGQGQGPVGAVMQGWSPGWPDAARKRGTPLLQGVSIYQKNVGGKVKRAIMTFRVASSKHRDQQGRWEHPGNAPVRIMEDTAAWAQEQWDKLVAPELVSALVTSVS